jgi:hypothetical protein
LATAAQYHKDIEQLLKTDEDTGNGKTDPNSKKKSRLPPKDTAKEPATKKRKLEYTEVTKDSSIHQAIIFQELNTISGRFEELHKVFGDSLLKQLKEHASFYTHNKTSEG